MMEDKREARVWNMAKEVFKDEERAQRFLHTPHQLLRGRTPLEVATEGEEGSQEVIEILGRLKYGSAV